MEQSSLSAPRAPRGAAALLGRRARGRSRTRPCGPPARRVGRPAAPRAAARASRRAGPRRAGAWAALAAAWAALAAAGLAGCAEKGVEIVESRPAMDTVVMVRAIAPTEAAARLALAAAWEEMQTAAPRLDRHRQGADVWRINQDAGRWHTEVDPLVVTCLAAAKEVWTLSGGAFDPTVGPLLDLWKEAERQDRLPTDEQVAEARALVGLDKVEMLVAGVPRTSREVEAAPPGAPPPEPADLVRTMHSVGLRAGMRLDLGGIAKGYLAGRMARRMEAAGATAGLIAAAGDVYAFGRRPPGLVRKGGDPRWGVAVQDPRFPGDPTRQYTAVHVRDQGIDTSGHYYRGYAIQGRRYSHILDPRTGRPVDAHLASVTVVADDPAVADALATAIAVLGVQEGLALVEKTPGAECLLLEWAPKEGQAPTAEGAPPPHAELIPHRSSGFAALEFQPAE